MIHRTADSIELGPVGMIIITALPWWILRLYFRRLVSIEGEKVSERPYRMRLSIVREF